MKKAFFWALPKRGGRTFFKKAHPSIYCCCSIFLFYKISSAWTKTICGYAFDLNGKRVFNKFQVAVTLVVLVEGGIMGIEAGEEAAYLPVSEGAGVLS